jgi:hypothetical protein
MENGLYILLALLLGGAVAHGGTLLHSFAVAFDMFIQDLVWNAPIGVTISSRAGLAARNGKPLGAKIVNFIMLSQTHCEEAIQADIDRANQALGVLNGK